MGWKEESRNRDLNEFPFLGEILATLPTYLENYGEIHDMRQDMKTQDTLSNRSNKQMKTKVRECGKRQNGGQKGDHKMKDTTWKTTPSNF